jgi:hypothetical protein
MSAPTPDKPTSDKLKIAIVDTYYPEFLKSCEKNAPMVGYCSYAQALDWILQECFGTFDAYSRGLTACGWETCDIIANSTWLWNLWRKENGGGIDNVPLKIIDRFNPDVIFMQDLHAFTQRQLAVLKDDYFLAGQCSCAWPGDHIVELYDIIFTSFPHYMERLTSLGVKAVFLPLAFDPEVHHRLIAHGVLGGERGFPVSFVGGMSNQFGERARNLHRVVDTLADSNIKFTVLGYGNATFNVNEIWALPMYQLYGQSKIVLNIHHPAAQGFSNNLRMFEATGMGAMLLTEHSTNISDYFTPSVECVTYRSIDEAIDLIKFFLAHDNQRKAIAQAGQRHTLTEHTYFNRMPIVSVALQELVL